MKDRVYVCHTYYHVYVTFLKELNRPEEEHGGATLVLSTMSTDFTGLADRVKASGVFEDVVIFEEKRDSYFPELDQYTHMKGNQIKIMLGRMKYTKLYGKLEEPFIPLDFTQYKDIYVFCDSDPIGFYLSYKKIPYHAIEDGLDTMKYFHNAHHRNSKFFGLKVFLSSLNLIFIQDGYGKYCIDMEVNDLEGIRYKNKKYFAVPRRGLVEKLTVEQKQLLLKVFVANVEQLEKVAACGRGVLVLTEDLCDMETRERIFKDIVARFETEGEIVIKPHPRDIMDYSRIFPDKIIIERKVPMEMLEFIPGLRFAKVVSVFTAISELSFAEEKIRLGAEFMDRYEDPSIHSFQ